MDGNCWSELPPELLSLICDRLDVPHILRFGAVCRSWRSVVVQYTPYRRRVLAPWLIFAREGEEPTTTIFRIFDLCENRNYSIDTPGPADAMGRRHCLGTGFGWVVAMDMESFRLSLLNPITRRRIALPRLYLTTFCPTTWERNVVHVLRHKEGDQGECTEEEMWHRPRKAMLTSSPDHGDWTVVVTLVHPFDPRIHVRHFDPGNQSCRLVYLRNHDHVWTMVDVSVHIYDVICHQGRVYTLSGDGKISNWDFSVQPPKCTVIFSPKVPVPAAIDVQEDHDDLEEDSWVEFGYLVPRPRAGGDFLQVWRYRPDRMDEGYKLFTKVFRVDLEEQELVKIRSLDGDTVFAGRNAPVCVVSSHDDDDFPTWLMRDCIYFSDQRTEEGLPMEAYEPVDDRHSYYLPQPLDDVCSTQPYSVWFTPSLA